MARKKKKRRQPYRKSYRCGWSLGQAAQTGISLAALAVGVSAIKSVNN